jgi:hypothetical protein
MQVNVMQKLNKGSLTMLLLVVSAFILTSCAKGVSNENTERLILPTLFQYSIEEQQILLQELESGSCQMSDKFIEDYGIVRQQIREALK